MHFGSFIVGWGMSVGLSELVAGRYGYATLALCLAALNYLTVLATESA